MGCAESAYSPATLAASTPSPVYLTFWFMLAPYIHFPPTQKKKKRKICGEQVVAAFGHCLTFCLQGPAPGIPLVEINVNLALIWPCVFILQIGKKYIPLHLCFTRCNPRNFVYM